MLEQNWKETEARILAACLRAGRQREEVTLVAVSKTKPVEMLQEAYDLGARVFGENKVQEITAKYDQLPPDIRWHMIGHLQRNKVKYIIDKVAMIHSVDSLRLAETISQEAVRKERIMPILIEVNVAEEESKFGLRTDETISLVEQIAALPNLEIHGLMTIAPFVDDPEENRPVFRTLRELSGKIRSRQIPGVRMDILSMGMTNDYEVAIEEGATMVRVGTGIFGERNYTV